MANAQDKVQTHEEVHRRVEEILEMDRYDRDPERAHHAQDRLYVDVLRAVAAGHPWSLAMAGECLRIADSDTGARWFA
jgi:hypothetical protein